MFDECDSDDKTQYQKLFCMTWGGDAEVCREMRNSNLFEMGNPVDTHWDNAGRYWVVYEVETSMSLKKVREWEEEILKEFAPEAKDPDLLEMMSKNSAVNDSKTLDAMEARGKKVAY